VSLIRGRTHCACGFLQKNGSPLLVAIVGSRVMGTTGLEVWNPANGSVNLLIDVLPQEQPGSPLKSPGNL